MFPTVILEDAVLSPRVVFTGDGSFRVCTGRAVEEQFDGGGGDYGGGGGSAGRGVLFGQGGEFGYLGREFCDEGGFEAH